MSPRGYWYAAGHYSASEHGGTHIDAPIHFSRDGTTVDQISLKTLISPAVIIDVSDACAKNNDYRLSFVGLLKASLLVKSENLMGGGQLLFGAKSVQSAPNQPFVA